MIPFPRPVAIYNIGLVVAPVFGLSDLLTSKPRNSCDFCGSQTGLSKRHVWPDHFPGRPIAYSFVKSSLSGLKLPPHARSRCG
jgi:hypothetical protein